MPHNAQLHLGDLFRSRRERGRPGLPVTSVTMNDGLVQRNTLNRKDNGNLAPEQHLLIRKGDIAYNMMRMWQGASGLADHDGIVSPAYVVAAPKDGIDPLFASYWFKSARMIHLFWAYSYGITGDRLRLYYKDFARIPVAVPPKPKQERIGRILATMDRAIEGMEKLIAAKREYKKGLVQQLLTGRRRLPGFTKPWSKREFRQLASVSKKRFDPKNGKSQSCVELEHISQGDGRLLNTVDSRKQKSAKVVFDKGDVLYGKLRPNLRKSSYVTSMASARQRYGFFSPSIRFVAVNTLPSWSKPNDSSLLRASRAARKCRARTGGSSRKPHLTFQTWPSRNTSSPCWARPTGRLACSKGSLPQCVN